MKFNINLICLIIYIAKETCPFCDEILPDPMSDQMKLALDRINNNQGI